MHEMSIVMAACDQISSFAKENDISQIAEVVYEIGEGSGIVIDYFKKVYPIATKGTILEGSEAIIEIVPGMATCMDCFEIYNVIENKGCCPQCGSRNKDVLSGTEFNIKEIHIPE